MIKMLRDKGGGIVLVIRSIVNFKNIFLYKYMYMFIYLILNEKRRYK